MGYLLLAGAVVFEVFATTMMKMSNGFSVIIPTIACVLGYILCFFFLGKALEHIELSIVYAVWAGLGIVLTVIVALVIFGDAITLPVIIGIVLILAGVVTVNLFGSAH